MHQNVLEELGHLSLMEMEGVKGQSMAASYATSFFYQVALTKHSTLIWRMKENHRISWSVDLCFRKIVLKQKRI